MEGGICGHGEGRGPQFDTEGTVSARRSSNRKRLDHPAARASPKRKKPLRQAAREGPGKAVFEETAMERRAPTRQRKIEAVQRQRKRGREPPDGRHGAGGQKDTASATGSRTFPGPKPACEDESSGYQPYTPVGPGDAEARAASPATVLTGRGATRRFPRGRDQIISRNRPGRHNAAPSIDRG